jgi:hypothetical protein
MAPGLHPGAEDRQTDASLRARYRVATAETAAVRISG